jgi:hypothetical protein
MASSVARLTQLREGSPLIISHIKGTVPTFSSVLSRT